VPSSPVAGTGHWLASSSLQLVKKEETGTATEKKWLADAKSRHPNATPTELLILFNVMPP
jgi:hypothetical protein